MKKALPFLLIVFLFSNSFGQSWSPVGSGMNGNVLALCDYDSLLFAGGTFSSAGSNPANNIAQWNNTNWSPLGSGVNGRVNAIRVYNGKVFIGGKFDSAGGIPAKNIAVWNGSSWASVGSGVNDSVYALAVYSGQLYAGGKFDSAGTKVVNYIASWNGTTWSNLDSGAVAPVYALNDYHYYNMYSVQDSALMVGTILNDSLLPTYQSYIAEWNGISWNYDTGTYAVYAPWLNRIYTFADFYGTLTTGGPSCDTNVPEGDETNYVSQWVGYLWASLIAWITPGGGPQGGPVYALSVSSPNDTVLYAGGAFTSVYDTGYSGITANYVASCTWGYNSDTWDSVGGGVNGNVYALTFFGGNLYAGGAFTDYYHSHITKPGSLPANHIAVYKTNKSTGINNVKKNNTVKVYPNPFTSSTSILFSESGKHELEVEDITGRVILQVECIGPKYELHRGSLTSGMYFIKVTDAQSNVLVSKILVQ